MPKTCDQRTVGVVIRDRHLNTLMITRGTAPAGIAPVAGHADLAPGTDHADLSGLAEVACAEVREEVGLVVTEIRPSLVADLWIPSWCRRRLPAGAVEHGHRWTVYRATATGDLVPDPRETAGARWYSPTAVQELAERTAAYATGQLAEDAWQAAPGLEPVWCALLGRMCRVHLRSDQLRAIGALACTPEQLLSRA